MRFLVLAVIISIPALAGGASNKSEFGNCQSDASGISRGIFDLGAYCSNSKHCPSDPMPVVWFENKAIKAAIAPSMGGAVVYLGKKGLNAKNGVACNGNILCKEQWLGNRAADRGRQFQIALRDQTHFRKHSATQLLCGNDESGCGWNPTQGGSAQPTKSGETGGCSISPTGNDCNVDALQSELPTSQAKKVYVRSKYYLNFAYRNPPQSGDSSPLQTDVWSEQWYCLKNSALTVMVKLHHTGDDVHLNFSKPEVGPGSELAALFLQGGVDEFLYGTSGTAKTVSDAKDLNTSFRFQSLSSDRWFGVRKNAVNKTLSVRLSIPTQKYREDFSQTNVSYWSQRGVPDKEYPVAAATFLQQLNIRAKSEYLWNLTVGFQP